MKELSWSETALESSFQSGKEKIRRVFGQMTVSVHNLLQTTCFQVSIKLSLLHLRTVPTSAYVLSPSHFRNHVHLF